MSVIMKICKLRKVVNNLYGLCFNDFGAFNTIFEILFCNFIGFKCSKAEDKY